MSVSSRRARIVARSYTGAAGARCVSLSAAPDVARVLIVPVRFREATYSAWIVMPNGDSREHYRAGSFRQCLNAARSFFGIRAWNGVTA